MDYNFAVVSKDVSKKEDEELFRIKLNNLEFIIKKEVKIEIFREGFYDLFSLLKDFPVQDQSS